MTAHGPTPVAEPSAQEARLERLRERIARTTGDERQLRVMLVLAHEALRRADANGPAEEAGKPASAPWAPVARDDYAALVRRIHDAVRAAVPAGARLLVVSRGDDSLLVPGFDAAHFPQGPDGGYAGFYPENSEAAVAHLERCRADGFEYLVLPATGFWWLEFYGELARHLLVGTRVAHHDADCLIFDLRPQPQGAPTE